MTTLVVVEGYGKLPSFRRYLTEGYRIEATGGHIIDLDEHKMSVDFENNFEPSYCIKPKKHEVVADLKKAFKKCKDVLIASDPDREGEFIAFSIAKELGIKNPKRIRFGDTTKESIKKAVKNVGTIDYDLVNAQKLRRVLDRIIGYQVSPVLCRSLGIGKLSAGRVMSVVVKLIVEQENKINEFFEGESECYFCTTGDFIDGKNSIHAILYTTDIANQATDDDDQDDKPEKKPSKKGKSKKATDETVNDNNEQDNSKGTQSKIKSITNAKNLMKNIMKSTFKVGSVTTKESVRSPSAPFTTATMLQEASRKLGMSADCTTRAAQKLYEGEYVTYIRTDSTSMAETAIASIGQFICEEYGKEYHRPLNYEVKSKNAQEAHEAIRPTKPEIAYISSNAEKKIASDEIRLYNLIWKRAIASQMSPAVFDVTTVKINISKSSEYFFITQYEKNKFKGFLAVYDMKNVEEDDPDVDVKSAEDEEDIYIPKLGTVLVPSNITSNQNYKRPPSRFNEASLINKLDIKNLGIGRPSTIPTMIKKIQEVDYVIKKDCKGVEKNSLTFSWNGKSPEFTEQIKKTILGKDTNRFVPTHLGINVTNFLNGYFPDIMDYKFTAKVEKDLDDVAHGNAIWTDILQQFYSTFEPLIKNINSTIIPKAIMKKDDRNLGKDPITGHNVLITTKKHGPVVVLVSDSQNEIKIAPIKDPYIPKKLTLEQALEILEFPKTLGIYLKKEIVMKVGDFGHYLDVGDPDKTGIRVPLGFLDKEVASNFVIADALKAIEENEKRLDEKNKDILWQNHDAKHKYMVRENERDGKKSKYIMVVPLIKPKIQKPPVFVGIDIETDLDQLTLKDVVSIVAKYHERKKSRGKKENLADKKDSKKDSKNDSDKEHDEKKPKKKTTNNSEKKPKKKTSKTSGVSSLFASHKK